MTEWDGVTEWASWWRWWRIGWREQYHGQWVVRTPTGLRWDAHTGVLVRPPAPPPPQWWEQPIGLDVLRCPECAAVEAQPDLRFRIRSLAGHRPYVRQRVSEGATGAQVARELGLSRERVYQLIRDLRPQWL
jgi:hypothetical protein